MPHAPCSGTLARGCQPLSYDTLQTIKTVRHVKLCCSFLLLSFFINVFCLLIFLKTRHFRLSAHLYSIPAERNKGISVGCQLGHCMFSEVFALCGTLFTPWESAGQAHCAVLPCLPHAHVVWSGSLHVPLNLHWM